jgi:hypothetical protein
MVPLNGMAWRLLLLLKSLRVLVVRIMGKRKRKTLMINLALMNL